MEIYQVGRTGCLVEMGPTSQTFDDPRAHLTDERRECGAACPVSAYAEAADLLGNTLATLVYYPPSVPVDGIGTLVPNSRRVVMPFCMLVCASRGPQNHYDTSALCSR